MRRVFSALTLIVLALPACTTTPGPHRPEGAKTVENMGRHLLPTTAAGAVLAALKAKDGARLAALVHPQKGVRFSPYAFIDPQHDVVMNRAEVEQFWTDTAPRTWGTQDGTGAPINLTPSQYAQRFILDRDFATAPSVNINNDQATGNSLNNAAQVYPSGTRIEYYLPPTAGGIDWRALRLVLEQQGPVWYLVGIIHDEWTT